MPGDANHTDPGPGCNRGHGVQPAGDLHSVAGCAEDLYVKMEFEWLRVMSGNSQKQCARWLPMPIFGGTCPEKAPG